MLMRFSEREGGGREGESMSMYVYVEGEASLLCVLNIANLITP